MNCKIRRVAWVHLNLTNWCAFLRVKSDISFAMFLTVLILILHQNVNDYKL